MENMKERAALLAALADPTRLKLLHLLSQSREFNALCVNALAEMHGVSQSAVSQHLRVLRMAGLVKGERRGYHIHYSINPEAFKRCQEMISEVANFGSEETSQDESKEDEMHQGHEEHEGHERMEDDCGCGGRGHHEGHEHGFGHRHHHGGMGWGGMPHEGCGCPWHQPGMGGFRMGMMGMHAGMGMGFGRHFISKDEIITRLEEYLKELQSEAKAVEEHIAEIKKRGEEKDL